MSALLFEKREAGWTVIGASTSSRKDGSALKHVYVKECAEQREATVRAVQNGAGEGLWVG